MRAFRANSLLQLLFTAVIVSLFEVWLLLKGLTILFDGYALEWYSLLLGDPVEGLMKFFIFATLPFLAGIQGFKMIGALRDGAWIRSEVDSTALWNLLRQLYAYTAVALIALPCIVLYKVVLFVMHTS
ncbi:MAG: hypothetical protein RLZZ234_120 [Candidatus Parcubacteria bacterium]|jgi:hypothetical protein